MGAGNPNSDPHACVTTILVTMSSPQPPPLSSAVLTVACLSPPCNIRCHNVCQQCQNLSTGISHSFPDHSPWEQITGHTYLPCTMLHCSSLHSPKESIRSYETRVTGSYKSPNPPPHWNHYKYHHLLVTNIQPHWQQHNCLQGEFSFYLPKAIPHPSPKDSIMCRADRTLKHTVYLFPLAHLYLLFSHPKLFLWNLRHFDGPVYPVTQNSRVSSPWSIPQNPSGGNLLLLWAVRDAIEIESVSSNLPDGKKVQWSKAEFNDLSWLNREGKKEDKVSLANKLQRVSNA